VGVDVGSGVEVAVGTRVSIERGVASGGGADARRQANNKSIRHDHLNFHGAHPLTKLGFLNLSG
jgi:hypothetical protein